MKSQFRDFNQEALVWDDNPARVKLAEDVAAAMMREVVLRSDMDVLDFGCGTGLIALKLAPEVRSVTGADLSRGMLDVLEAKVARQGLPHVSTRHLEKDGDLGGPYDVIVSSMTFHHIEEIESLLVQFHRALKPEGVVCIADLDLDQGEFHADNTGVFHGGFERTALRELFEKSGFSSVTVSTAAEMAKLGRAGELRKFGIFLLVANNAKPRPKCSVGIRSTMDTPSLF